MKSIWFDGCRNQQERDERKKELLAYRNAFDHLKEILDKHYKKKECCRDYEVPNWELRQIAANEYNHVLEDIKELITITKG